MPKLICFVFRGDAGQRACCNEITLHSFATNGKITYYSARFAGNVDITLSINSDLRRGSLTLAEGSGGLPAFWRLQSTALAIDEIYRIDHVNTTCLTPPAIAISGVTVTTPSGPCVGTVTLETYRAAKLAFKRLDLQPSEDILIPYPPCNCGHAVDTLCVWGRRKVDGPIEGVQFKWDRALNDRWSYSPPCGGLLAQEHIYLRGDAYGKCWLELDFEQSGNTTNDWANPPNNFDGNNPHEIRPGMLPIDSCVCGLSARSSHTELHDNRYVAITGGYCQGYDYRYCGKCRCVPEKLCIVGSIDGQIFQGQLTWDGEQWTSLARPYLNAFSLSLVTGDCSGLPLGRTDPSVCAIQANGTFIVPFKKSPITECGPRLSFSLTSDYDPTHPNVNNWIYGRASLCGGCKDINCGPCLTERCGGPPDVLYADLELNIRRGYYPYNDPSLSPLTFVTTTCNIQVRLMYYQRWMSTLLICGYIGAVTIPGGGTFMLDWQFSNGEKFLMTRINSAGVKTAIVNFAFPYKSCDPFLWISNWNTIAVMGRLCPWGPETEEHAIVEGVEYRVTLSE